MIVSNQDADGYVSVDGIQFVPVEIAREERAGKRDSGFVETGGSLGGRQALGKAGATPGEPPVGK